MDPWISSQPSLSLDLHVGLPTLGLGRHQAPLPVAALAKPKVLVEENFLQPLKKEPEVAALETELQRMSEENRRLAEALTSVAAKYDALRSQYTEMVASAAVHNTTTTNNPSSGSEGGSVSPSRKRKTSETSMDTPAAAHHHQHLHLAAAADQMECTSGEPCKRIREEHKPKVSKLYVHADPSDLSLVVKDGAGKNAAVTKPPSPPRQVAAVAPHHTQVHHQQHQQQEAVAAMGAGGEAVGAAAEMIRRNLAEQMAMTLTRDPSFKAALVTALSGRILELSPTKD
nr:unnamed protein product [Digitaria exilis]